MVQKKDYLVSFAFSHDNDEIYLADIHINLITYNVKKQAVTGQVSLAGCIPVKENYNISSILDGDDFIWIST